MKITFVGHASILIETRGLRIISDPWWGRPCFGVQWWSYPLPVVEPVFAAEIDYIYISHGHADHFHLPTLRSFSRNSKVVIPTGSDMAKRLTQAGFHVIEVAADQEYELGNGVKCRVMPTHGDDSLMLISDGSRTCLNLNDALHSAPRETQRRFANLLRSLYTKIDYLFCGYGTASHFPNCYRIPGKDSVESARVRQAYFNRQWAWLIAAFNPRFSFPFAADVALLEEELFWWNEAVQHGEWPVAALREEFPSYSGQAMNIAPGFVIEDDAVMCPRYREAVDIRKLKQALAHGIKKSRQYEKPTDVMVQSTLEMLRSNALLCNAYLREFPHDYLVLIRLRGTMSGYQIGKIGSQIKVDLIDNAELVAPHAGLVATTRLEYLRASLMTKYGSEILFVGSGVVMDIRSRADAENNLQSEFRVVVERHELAPIPPKRMLTGSMATLKNLAKAILGRKAPLNLYDLVTWTRWKS